MDIERFVSMRDAYPLCEATVLTEINSSIYNPALVPDFMIIGAPRCGTTFLANSLSQADGLFVVPEKEPKFFSANIGRFPYAWYLDKFRDGIGKLKAEATPSYAGLPLTRIQLIHSMNPAMKVIYLMRDPRERLASEWKHSRQQPVGWSSTEVASFVLHEGPVIATDYADNLERWLAVFSEDQILPVFFDDICTSPSEVIDRVGSFLGTELNVDESVLRNPLNSTWEDQNLYALVARVCTPLFAARVRRLRKLMVERFPAAVLPGWINIDWPQDDSNRNFVLDLADGRAMGVVDGYYVCGPSETVKDLRYLTDVWTATLNREPIGIGYYLYEAISTCLAKEGIVSNRLYANCHADKQYLDLFLVRENYFGWNIIAFNDRFFCAPIGAGHFDLRVADQATLARLIDTQHLKVFDNLSDALEGLKPSWFLQSSFDVSN